MTSLTVELALPSGEIWPKVFGLNLVALTMAIMQKPVPGYDKTYLKIANQQGSILPKSRQELVQKAIAEKCSHVLFIDSDQGFPAWTLHKLASAGKMVVAANIPVKRIPSLPTARDKSATWPGGDVVYTRKNSTGLRQVWRVGTGIMLINLDVFRDQPLPWFETKWTPEINDFMGEDWFFCQWLEAKGIPIFIDHDLSKVVTHIGHYEYSHGDVVEQVVEQQPRDRRALGSNALCMVDT